MASIEERISALEQTILRSKTLEEVEISTDVNPIDLVGVYDKALKRMVGVPRSFFQGGDGETFFVNGTDAIQNVAPTSAQVSNPSAGDLAIKTLTDNKSEYWKYTTSWNREGIIDFNSVTLASGQGIEFSGGQVNLGDEFTGATDIKRKNESNY